MPAFDYLNQNAFHDRPFQAGPVLDGLTIATGWVLDAGLTFGVLSGHDGVDPVVLASLSRSGDAVTFIFTSGDVVFTFTADATDPPGTTVYAEGAPAADDQNPSPAYGFGFLVLGDLGDLPVGEWDEDSDGSGARLVATAIESLARRHVHRVSVANQAGDAYATEVAGLSGDVRLAAGRFCRLALVPGNRQVVLSVTDSLDAGGPGPCQDLAAYPDGEAPEDGVLCKDLLTTINGVGASPASNGFRLTGARGITVTPDGDHALRIRIDQHVLFPREPDANRCEDT